MNETLLMLSLLPYYSFASALKRENILEFSLCGCVGVAFRWDTSAAAQNPQRKGRSIKPLGIRLGSQVGTHAGQGFPSGAVPVHPNKCVMPSSSLSDVELVFGLFVLRRNIGQISCYFGQMLFTNICTLMFICYPF